MKEISKYDKEYINWLADIKKRIRSVQTKASLAANRILIEFYWELGKSISEKQTSWGSKFLDQLSKDLREEFQDMNGLSIRNLKYARQFY